MDFQEKNLEMDLEALCQELGLDSEQFSQFASLFLDVAATDMERMRKALACEDLASVAEAAHSIKGAALTLELERICAMAKALEANAKSGKKEKLQEGIQSLAQELDRLEIFFQEQGLIRKE